eukprot:Lithocolla_globosa_v1_NODE_1384_length_2617_cov_4.443794.p2 type:complete len:159 gc:universal NODE_1384_length_2617_cov_4.443794:1683-2159(+)
MQRHVVENALCMFRACVLNMQSNQTFQLLNLMRVSERHQLDHLSVAEFAELAMFVIHIGDASAHSGSKVASDRAQHHHTTARHVLTPVVSDTFDDSGCTRVSDTEALGCHACKESRATSRAIQTHIADNDVVFGREGRNVGRVHADHSSRQPFSNIVI